MDAEIVKTWSNVIPNFGQMPEQLQQWLVHNLPSFIQSALQQGINEGVQVGKDQHWGVSATGNAHLVIGGNYDYAAQGYHNEVVGATTTRTRHGSVITNNLADEFKSTAKANSHLVSGDSFYLTRGTLNQTVNSHASTEIGGDHVLIVKGDSAAVFGTNTLYAGTSNTNPNQVTYAEAITGSKYSTVTGTSYTQAASVVVSIGGELPTTFHPPTTAPTPSSGSTTSSQAAGATAHPSLAFALAPVVSIDKDNSNSQYGTDANTAASDYKTTKTNKTNLATGALAWQTVSSGAGPLIASLYTKHTAAPDTPAIVYTCNYTGSTQENTTGDSTSTVMGKKSTTHLKGTDSLSMKSESNTVIGMAGDTVIGLSSDALIGLAMPFNLMTMGQTLICLDENVLELVTRPFKLDLTELSITTPGGNTYSRATAIQKAEKLAKAAEDATKLAEDTKRAQEVLKQANELKADVLKAQKLEADIKEAEEAVKAAQKAEEAAKAAKAAKDAEEVASGVGGMGKQFERVDEVELGGEKLSEIEKAAEATKTAASKLKEMQQTLAEAQKAMEAKSWGETGTKRLEIVHTNPEKTFSFLMDSSQKAKDVMEAAETLAARATTSHFAQFAKDFFKVTDELVTKKSIALGIAKTLAMGVDLSAIPKALGASADVTKIIVALTKVGAKTTIASLNAKNRSEFGAEQAKYVKGLTETLTNNADKNL